MQITVRTVEGQLREHCTGWDSCRDRIVHQVPTDVAVVPIGRLHDEAEGKGRTRCSAPASRSTCAPPSRAAREQARARVRPAAALAPVGRPSLVPPEGPLPPGRGRIRLFEEQLRDLRGLRRGCRGFHEFQRVRQKVLVVRAPGRPPVVSITSTASSNTPSTEGHRSSLNCGSTPFTANGSRPHHHPARRFSGGLHWS